MSPTVGQGDLNSLVCGPLHAKNTRTVILSRWI